MSKYVNYEVWEDCKKAHVRTLALALTLFLFLLSSIGGVYHCISEYAADLTDIKIKLACVDQRVGSIQKTLERSEQALKEKELNNETVGYLSSTFLCHGNRRGANNGTVTGVRRDKFNGLPWFGPRNRYLDYGTSRDNQTAPAQVQGDWLRENPGSWNGYWNSWLTDTYFQPLGTVTR